MKKSILAFILLGLITAFAGTGLSLTGFQDYIIILGFRFHLSALVAGIVIILLFKNELSNPFKGISISRISAYSIYLLLLGCLVYGAAYLKKMQLSDPDFTFEFGVSSIIDFPLYIIWNFPQFLLLYLVFDKIRGQAVLKYLLPILIVLLFSGQFYQLNKKLLNADVILVIALGIIQWSIICAKSRNAVEFTVWSFLSVWVPVLMAGSSSTEIINIFFAKNFSEWEGFTTLKGVSANYIISGFFIAESMPLLFVKK